MTRRSGAAATPIFDIAVSTPAALVTCRQQAAALAALLGITGAARTRLLTAVAELSRAMLLGCTEVTLRCRLGDTIRYGEHPAEMLVISFRGRRLPGGNGAAVDQAAAAAARLVDEAETLENDGWLKVRLLQSLPRATTTEEIAGWRTSLAGAAPRPLPHVVPALLAPPLHLAPPLRLAHPAVQAAGAGLWSWMPDTGAVYLDERARAILCGPEGDGPATRQAVLDLLHPDDSSRVAAGLDFAAAGRRPLLETFRVLWPDGTVRNVTLRGGPLEPAGLGGFCLDVTEEVSEQLLRRHRERQRLEAVGELAGSLAHEINNLLQPIIGLVDMARDDLDPALPLHADLGIVLDSAREAATIIRDVLIFARPADDAGRQSQPLRDSLEAALRFVRSLQPPSVTLDCHVAGSLAGRARLDANDMRQVLTNLVTNAIHAMDGAGTVRITAQRLASDTAPLAELPPGDYAELTVADNGHGIDPALHALIFEPFFTTKAVGQGTGLGLSVVFGIIRGCGGAIAVDSAPGRGTTFRLYVPVETAPCPQPTTSSSS